MQITNMIIFYKYKALYDNKEKKKNSHKPKMIREHLQIIIIKQMTYILLTRDTSCKQNYIK